jgi:hypothetical protein
MLFLGTEKFIDSLLDLMDHEPSVLLGAVSQQFEIDCSTFITC